MDNINILEGEGSVRYIAIQQCSTEYRATGYSTYCTGISSVFGTTVFGIAKAPPLRNEKGVKIHWFPVFSVYIDSVCITEL